ncbi:uncharacterized protein EV420DRAFT_851328 [Desarmillaria tabescens]|uniref:Uncharacterized protein n=1 Tax=Armillaria tabescens TaxID=1929756 RepID=A0AA39JUX1_ARMTA|nr:uncharacterized protein EV420DRAFT_851328 [Desarmillaria tabescens]KAK0448286.1 hypothetical protein EV420DRAFT_851328 [Desarmillaria tabescens]
MELLLVLLTLVPIPSLKLRNKKASGGRREESSWCPEPYSVARPGISLSFLAVVWASTSKPLPLEIYPYLIPYYGISESSLALLGPGAQKLSPILGNIFREHPQSKRPCKGPIPLRGGPRPEKNHRCSGVNKMQVHPMVLSYRGTQLWLQLESRRSRGPPNDLTDRLILLYDNRLTV